MPKVLFLKTSDDDFLCGAPPLRTAAADDGIELRGAERGREEITKGIWWTLLKDGSILKQVEEDFHGHLVLLTSW